MESSHVHALMTPEGKDLMASLPPYSEQDALALSSRLRKDGYAPELIAEALTQSRLREKASAKFGDFAERMFFTAAGLEQATRLTVAAHHASRFRNAGATHIIDMGCGIGADSMACAALGLRVTSIEVDPLTACFARANLAPFPEAEVVEADARHVDIAAVGADAIWMDPARRDAAGHRLKNPEDWAPPLSMALGVARHFASAGIKVAPGIAHGLCPEDAHVQWISVDGDLVEAVIWMGRAAPQPGRSALVIQQGNPIPYDAGVSSASEAIDDVVPLPLGPYIYEPDPAVIRSGGIARLCREHGLAPVSERIAYLTGEAVTSPLITGFRVIEVLPLAVKDIKKALAAHGVRRLEIKKRATDQDPEKLRAKLSLPKKASSADKKAVLLLCPVLGKHRAILAERV